MDDGFVIILAIIVFSVFRNVIQEAKKKGGKTGSDSFDTSADHDDARDRTIEALRRWEAKQRGLPAPGSSEGPAARNERLRIPRPGEHRTDVRLPTPKSTQQPADHRRPRPFEVAESPGTEQTRREAYDAIRDLLSGKTARPPPAPTRPDQGWAPAPTRQTRPAPTGQTMPARAPESAPTVRPRVQGTIRRRPDAGDPNSRPIGPPDLRPDEPRKSPAGLKRLDALPPVARGIVYAELLGKPVAFRGPGEGTGD